MGREHDATSANIIGVARRPSRLQALREEQGWTQEELAAHMKVSQSALANIEHGRTAPTPIQRARLAEELEIPPEYVDDAGIEIPDERFRTASGIRRAYGCHRRTVAQAIGCDPKRITAAERKRDVVAPECIARWERAIGMPTGTMGDRLRISGEGAKANLTFTIPVGIMIEPVRWPDNPIERERLRWSALGGPIDDKGMGARIRRKLTRGRGLKDGLLPA